MNKTEDSISQSYSSDSPSIPPGYKQTEVGVIPEEWKLVNLDNVCSMKSGESITSAGIDNFSPYPCYGGNGLRGFTTCYTHYGYFALIGRQGALCGNVVAAEGKFFASEHAVVVTARQGVDIQWLTYILGRMRLNRYSESSAQPGLSVSKILKLLIPFPPLEYEQRSIAAALSDMDALLDSLDRLIAKKRDLKQAAMQQLLTGEMRLPGFEGKWEVKRLGELGVFLKGSGVRKDDSQSGSIPCIRYGELYTHHNEYIKAFYSFITSDVASTARLLKFGDILFAGSGETREDIGKCVAFINECEAYAGGDIVIFRPQGLDPLFLGFSLNMPSVTRQKASKGQGDAVVHISTIALASLLVRLPLEIEEQTAIATVLSSMDAEIAALERRRNKTKDIKHAMMQELLTGKTRLL